MEENKINDNNIIDQEDNFYLQKEKENVLIQQQEGHPENNEKLQNLISQKEKENNGNEIKEPKEEIIDQQKEKENKNNELKEEIIDQQKEKENKNNELKEEIIDQQKEKDNKNNELKEEIIDQQKGKDNKNNESKEEIIDQQKGKDNNTNEKNKPEAGILDLQKEKEKETNKYNIIEFKSETKCGELFLVENKSGEQFLMNKIQINSLEFKSKILEEIKILKLIKSQYIFKIRDYFIEKKEENEIIYIIFENYIENNLHKVIYKKKILNNRIIWRIFVQLVLGLESLYLNKIFLNHLIPQNIYLDNENNIKIGGFDFLLDFRNNKEKNNLDFSSYESPEVLKGEEPNEKRNIWSLGCILYELVFKKKPFDNINRVNYFIPDKCEDDIKKFLSRLLCEEKKRLKLNQLIYDPIFKRKIFEVNLFYEFVKDNIKSKIIFL